MKAVCKNLDAVKSIFLLHAVFSLKPNWIWVRCTSYFCRNCFDQNFRKDSCCKGWRECELRTIKPRKRTNLLNSTAVNKKSITEDGNAANNKSVVEERTSSSHVTLETVEPTIGDYVGAVCEKAVYIGLVNDMDEEEAEIHFLRHNGKLHRQSKFKEPRVVDDVWVSLTDILCIIPEPNATKRNMLEICPEVLDSVLKKFEDWLKRS